MFALLSGGGTTSADSFAGLLDIATQMVTWSITTMGSFLEFAISHPVVLVLFMFTIIGFGLGLLMRLWHSVG